jgi:protein arginine kinase activator
MAKVVQCDCCGAPATIYLMQVFNGSTIRLHLCINCARAKGFVDEFGAPVEALLRADPLAAASEVRDLYSLSCSNCGLTIPQLAEKKLLGCERCYETFAEILSPILKQIHRGEKHRGKRPLARAIFILPMVEGEATSQTYPAISGKELPKGADSEQNLEAELKLAVTEERYEDAAKSRDQLNPLQRKKLAKMGQVSGKS